MLCGHPYRLMFVHSWSCSVGARWNGRYLFSWHQCGSHFIIKWGDGVIGGGCLGVALLPHLPVLPPPRDVCCSSLWLVSSSRLTLCTLLGVWTWSQSLRVAPVTLRVDGFLEMGKRGCSSLSACCGPGSGCPVGVLFWHAQRQLATPAPQTSAPSSYSPFSKLLDRVLPCLS